ncbi:hypothetical protein [Micromonospora sp. DT229]|uniref:hypothetical protein n=1 Tax=Micromonospora sp. DT229 TaxID=3393430 RepID=UPI003CF17811
MRVLVMAWVAADSAVWLAAAASWVRCTWSIRLSSSVTYARAAALVSGGQARARPSR